MEEDKPKVIKVVDVSMLTGDAALESVNHGIIECTCTKDYTCQACEWYAEQQK